MRTLIIAEAGVNHNGSLEAAKKLALTAKKCGADIVKFQTAKLNSMVSKHAYMADYQKKNIGVEMSQRDMLKKILLTYNDFIELAAYCKEINVCFLSTPFDLESIEFLKKLGCSMWKIPSGEITNYPYLVEIARTGKDIILSTGMSTLQEVDDALEVLQENGAGKITLLHCTTNYPTPMEDVNLNAMLTLKEKYGCAVGYSDHTKGIEVPIAAVALGAEVIEKHFTLDCRMEGPDHKASLEPDELEAMIRAIRNIEKALGDGIKIPSESEKANIAVARKSIIAADNIKVGDILTKENLTTKRPGTGISPMRWNEILGTRAIRNFEEDELIEI
ncbi:N-acetylneuraminate synthase [Acetatifactor muris]|uniref:N,N'-diacetyllegionaminic acid synthase n=1 Tax=Acetatifactor muris TaxID=879566 RepID=A0A2K4ZD26_9FIRM|nr:N-acetylneuraminate synthase [Acetatifactor muris]MCR2046775.1 N-acetylneuraminate synthase [Acetatifactor muris]SOY28369.1 N,N'-diacetyllegionaminic acid synthase [Acetatifactor muris]